MNCKECSKEFEPYRSSQTFCCNARKQKWHYNERAEAAGKWKAQQAKETVE